MCWVLWCFFFFKQKTAYERRISDWSSDVCSSDLSRALTATPDAIEAMFAQGSAATGDRLPAALDAIAAAAADKKYGLVASQSTYDKALGALARSDAHTSELPSLLRISHALFCFLNTYCNTTRTSPQPTPPL